ncbi:MAG: hypothetical protein OHK0044_03940 [Burkholderiaceae bacterium]
MISPASPFARPARRTRAAAVIVLLTASAVFGSAAQAQNAVRGKMLYGPPVPAGWPITCGSSGCHDGFPTVRKNKINNGTNATTTLNAINGNKGGMGILKGFVTATDAADIAAYIANPAAADGPSIAVSPASLTFSYTLAGATSAPMSFTVTNGGAAALSLTSLATSGANASEFRIANTSTCAAGGSVAAGGNCRVDVVFAPTASGAKSAAVTINHNAAGGTTSVALAGSAGAATPTISLSASALSFATVPLGSTSAAQTVTLSNTGAAALNITALTAGGSNPGDFTRGGSCAAGGTVAAGASCTITYTFAPSALGARSASLTIVSNNSGGNVTLSLSGSGVNNTPAIALSRTSIAFGNQQIGTTSAAQSVTVSNAGGGTLSVSGVAANNGVFATAGNCVGANLANGQSCTVSVTFAPTAAATVNGTLAITHNAAGSPSSVALTGTGTTAPVPAVALSRTAVSFAGVTAVGQQSIAERVTLTNNGPGSVTLNSVTASAEFNVVAGPGACRAGQTLAQGASCSIDVSFAPAAAGVRNGTLSIASGGAPSTLTASLAGTGSAVAAAAAAPNPTAVDFGAVRVGTAATPRMLTIADAGMTNLIVDRIVVDAPFQMASGGTCGAPPFTLTPGASCTVMVAYQPDTAGMHQGSLQVMGNATAPAVVALSGQAEQVTTAAAVGPTNVGFGGAGALGGVWLAALGLLAALGARRRAAR